MSVERTTYTVNTDGCAAALVILAVGALVAMAAFYAVIMLIVWLAA